MAACFSLPIKTIKTRNSTYVCRSYEDKAMKKIIRYVALPSVLIIAAALAFAPAGGAQSQKFNTPGLSIPRTSDGKPDFTGMYQWPSYMPGDQHGKGSAS